MDKEDLQQILNEMGVSSDEYDLEGRNLSDRYTLNKNSEGWSVYYSERGLKSGKFVFESESDACDYFLSIISKDFSLKKELDK